MELNIEVARKVLETVDVGLVYGVGNPVPGQMCVEAAVCYAMGLPHGDNPQCVGPAVRAFKIRLNDSNWSSVAARTAGLRRIAIAQLGSDQIDQTEFARLLAIETIKQIVPIALRAAASMQKNTEHVMALEFAALRCEQEGTREAALDAKTAADAAYAVAYVSNTAAYATADAAYAAAYASNTAAYASNTAAVGAADATAHAADATAHAAYASVKQNSILALMAQIGVDILVKMGTQGSQWLHLAD